MLDLTATGLGNDGFDLICDILCDENLQTLTVLKVGLNEITSTAVIEKLKNGITKSNLRELDISNNNLGNKGVRQIAQGI